MVVVGMTRIAATSTIGQNVLVVVDTTRNGGENGGKEAAGTGLI